jgi:hypothetical protein
MLGVLQQIGRHPLLPLSGGHAELSALRGCVRDSLR